MQRVQKLLSNHGYCSRRKAVELIKAGRVKVNGNVIDTGDKAGEKDVITIDENELKRTKKIYIAFNKPIHCVTALTDDQHKTIMHYIDIKERVFPIGRLDYNTTGLILLTNDGDFANRVMHPRYEIKKTYRVKADRHISEKNIKLLETGVELDDGKTSPAKVKILNDDTLELTIHEGKNRIIRRMMEFLGYKTREIERIKIGKLELKSLKTGEYKHLDKKDIDLIFS